MTDPLVCKMPECGGMLGDGTISLQTGCDMSSLCRACDKCGRVHSYDGFLMFNRPGSAVYLRNGSLEHIMEPITFDIGNKYKSTGYLYVCLEGKEEDGIPEMVDLGPDTPLVYDGLDENGMFRFHDECGIKYLLHRGDVNFVEALPAPKYFIWTLWPNDHGRWQMLNLSFDSEDSAATEKLMLVLGGQMVKVLPEGTKP